MTSEQHESLQPEGDLLLETETDSPWTVVVWNDPINLMDYVTFVFQKVFNYTKSKATKLMADVHYKGRASVFVGEKSESEVYVHKLHGYGLWATMEQD